MGARTRVLTGTRRPQDPRTVPDAVIIDRAFPDGNLEVHDMLVSEDVAFWEWTMTGTHEGEYNGIEPTGRTVALTGLSKTTIADGKIQEDWAYSDTQDLMAQLGASA